MMMIFKRCLERLFLVVEAVITASLYPFCLLRDRLAGQTGIPILMYHQIGRSPERATFCRDCVPPDRFEAQVRAVVDAGYRVIPLADAVRDTAPEARQPRGRRAFLTFDDGYRDQFVNAFPVLRRYRLPAIVFLVAGSIGRVNALPHLSLEGADVREGGPASGWLPLSWEQVRE